MRYNLGGYNGDELAGENKDKIAKKMTPADISKAQDMSSRCLESKYIDCQTNEKQRLIKLWNTSMTSC